jgi:hypothetical protein
MSEDRKEYSTMKISQSINGGPTEKTTVHFVTTPAPEEINYFPGQFMKDITIPLSGNKGEVTLPSSNPRVRIVSTGVEIWPRGTVADLRAQIVALKAIIKEQNK